MYGPDLLTFTKSRFVSYLVYLEWSLHFFFLKSLSRCKILTSKFEKSKFLVLFYVVITLLACVFT